MSEITQDNYNTALQNIRNLSIRVNLLNSNLQIVDEISGNVISGTITIDSNSDIRRTCSIQLITTDNTFNIEQGKIWLDRYIQIYTGIENISTGEIDWVNQGVYLINNPTLSYTGNSSILSFQGLDLMSKLTGLRDGYLTTLSTQIEQGSSIRNSIIALLELGGFTKYTIEENPITTPYLINIDVGGSIFDVLKELRDIVPNYEMFFDVNGTFVYQKIPTGEDDQILVSNDSWEAVKTGVEQTKEFDKIKNYVQVWGKSIEPSYFQTTTTTVSSSTYTITLSQTGITTNDIIGFVTPSIVSNPKIIITDGIYYETAYDLINEDGTYATIESTDQYYCIMKRSDGKFLFLGKQQIYATAQDDNPNSPYYVGKIGTKSIPLYGGEFDNIWSDDLAEQRARYEVYKRARMNDSITLTGVPLYYLDVNIKIEHQISSDYDSNQYLIKSITTDLSAKGTQTIQAIRFYPEYPSW